MALSLSREHEVLMKMSIHSRRSFVPEINDVFVKAIPKIEKRNDKSI